MSEEVLYKGYVDDIAALAVSCDFPQEAYVLVERFPSQFIADLRKERPDLLRFARMRNGIGIARYPSGRIFHNDFELRWEKEGGRYKVVYLGIAKYTSPMQQQEGFQQDSDTLSKLKSPQDGMQNSKHYYLFGEYLDESKLHEMGIPPEPDTAYYAEVRIPRLLPYPVLLEKPQRVRLAVREYADEATGRVQLFRFQGLETEEQKA